jgi:hypothetical protein
VTTLAPAPRTTRGDGRRARRVASAARNLPPLTLDNEGGGRIAATPGSFCPTQEAKQPLRGSSSPTLDAQTGSQSGEPSRRRSFGLLGGTFRARRARPVARLSSWWSRGGSRRSFGLLGGTDSARRHA